MCVCVVCLCVSVSVCACVHVCVCSDGVTLYYKLQLKDDMLCTQDSLMCLPVKLSQSLGSINQLVLCHRITSAVQLIDPQTTQSK